MLTAPTLSHRLRSTAQELASHGFHRVTPWWLSTLSDWLATDRRQLVLRVGRRGGKSSTLCLLSVVVALFERFSIPLGDVGVIAIVSVDRREATGRLTTIVAMLTALGVPHERRGDTIELTGRPLRFQVFTGSVAGVSGFTTVFAICDEVAKWTDKESGANPATEVLASLRPTMAGVTGARMVLSSSPMSDLDAHARAFTEGDTSYQVVAWAPTWVARPSLTEAQTHALEPDERVWSREYAAIPSAALGSAFSADHVERAMRRTGELRYGTDWYRPILVVDSSSGGGDSFVWAIAGYAMRQDVAPAYGMIRTVSRPHHHQHEEYSDDRGATWHPLPPVGHPDRRAEAQPVLAIRELDGIDGAFSASGQSDALARRMGRAARHAGARVWVSDNDNPLYHASSAKAHGMTWRPIKWGAHTGPKAIAKTEAVLRMRELLANGLIALPQDDALKRQLTMYTERFTAAGNITYAGRSGSHDDRAACVLLAVAADLRGLLEMSRYQVQRGKTVIDDCGRIMPQI